MGKRNSPVIADRQAGHCLRVLWLKIGQHLCGVEERDQCQSRMYVSGTGHEPASREVYMIRRQNCPDRLPPPQTMRYACLSSARMPPGLWRSGAAPMSRCALRFFCWLSLSGEKKKHVGFVPVPTWREKNMTGVLTVCNRQPHPATRRSQPPKPHRLQGGGPSSATPPLVGAGGRKSPPEKGTKGDAIFLLKKL